MKTYHCIGDLDQFGFNCLTGEACGLGLRLLFDISAPAKAILVKALGVQDIALRDAWNGGDAVGSVMLDRDICTTLAIFGMLEQGCIEVWQSVGENRDGSIHGIENEEELVLAKESNIGYPNVEGWRVWKYQGTAGHRNRHVMSGRVS